MFGTGAKSRFDVVHIERPALGTDYLQVIQILEGLLAPGPPPDKSKIVIDCSGVGEVIYEILSEEGLEPGGILITSSGKPSGNRGRIWNVPFVRLFHGYESRKFISGLSATRCNIILNSQGCMGIYFITWDCVHVKVAA
jgi:hypothetical protein